jgi:heat shock protein HtpX
VHLTIYILLAAAFLVVVGYKTWLLYHVSTRTQRGLAALERGDFSKAGVEFQKALLETKRTRNARSDSEVIALINLALLEERRKDPEACLRFAARAIHAMEGARDESGNFHLAFHIVARVLESNGEFGAAIRFRKEELGAQQAFSGKETPELALACFHLGRTLRLAEKYAEAVAAYEQSIRVWSLHHPANAVQMGTAETEMALTFSKWGKPVEAERYYRSAIDTLTDAEGEKGLNLARAWSNLGVLYARTERLKQAMDAYTESLKIRRARCGDHSPEVGRALNNCANCLRQLGKLAEAQEVAGNAIAMLCQPNENALANALDTLGWISLDRGRWEEAERHFREAYTLLLKNPARTAQDLHDFAERHAEALVRLGRFAEADECRGQWIRDTASSGNSLSVLAHSLLNDQTQRPLRAPGRPVAEPELKANSQLTRALVAIALPIGFYGLAILSMSGLGFLTMLFFKAHAYRLAVGCAGALYLVIASILPRRIPTEIPGPELKPAEHPDIFEVIEEIANSAKVQVPSSIYLVPQLNAYVEELGGWLGIGGRRVMGLGLPLLQTLNVDEMRAVIAHEFGHFVAGDTVFSRWIYSTRSAMIRAVDALQAVNSILRFPYEWYSALFLRITTRIARQQELSADRLAARITDPACAVSALRAIHSHLYSEFWSREIQPVVRCGFLPPISTGFQVFRDQRAASLIPASVDSDGSNEPHDPYDCHPPLPVRIRALEAMPGRTLAAADTRAAVTLLGDSQEMEMQLALAAGEPPAGGWKKIAWEDCAGKVHLPAWKEELSRFDNLFFAVRVRDVPLLAADHVLSRVRAEYGDEVDDWTREHAVDLVGRAIALALVRDGWNGIGAPGEPVWFEKEGARVNPTSVVRSLWNGEMTAQEWRRQANQANIAQLFLLSTEVGPMQLTPAEQDYPDPRAAMEFTLVQRRSSS